MPFIFISNIAQNETFVQKEIGENYKAVIITSIFI